MNTAPPVHRDPASPAPSATPPRPVPPRIDPARAAAQVLPLRRALLHEVRWRRPAYDRRIIGIAIVIVVVVHLLLAYLMQQFMRPRFEPESRAGVVSVSLIEWSEPPPSIAPPLVHEMPPLSVTAPQQGQAANAPAPPRQERSARQAAAAGAVAPGVEAIVETPVLTTRLYNADGSLRVAPPAEESAKPMDPLSQGLAAAKELRQRGHNVVRCKSTRFAKAYTPDESVGEGIARKYLSHVGLYNPHTAQEAAVRASEASASCDWQD
ncbi:hypothetical protein [Tahibacter amnicola]|uniref:Uncharacterized protein n=1 Tax=Tahibacter amnicola TaxID=2976241 RepID=A0ABY6BF93_9GAMM|nr:hypothetical protein [Tahibacter amnicola]UXI67286.1 hypothetical protein N4264_21490 [Tahibacter amnicola]